ncbi:oligosaccharide flippase family protein [Flagellimonas olearia]|uniref:Oligosaccharide flippase family protein n=1 Tax=Flagellimonas olearia TaxID=552546 RepID=A0A6I1DX54_9FLAO|nr:flippase [Allomuricauda olearia]KAB7528664.1 oligosaccharide flippase family protein [Allomuricauda olearia]
MDNRKWKFSFTTGAKKHSKHTLWMASEKVISLSINLLVGVWLARYLGPNGFGALNFAIAITAIFLPIVNFGLQGILVKELFNNPDDKNGILGTSFLLKLIIAFIVLLLIFFSRYIGIYTSEIEMNMILLVAISLLSQPFLVINSWYESQIDIKLASILKTLFFVLGSVIKIVLILKEAPLISFAILYSIEAFFVAVALVISYSIKDGSILNWFFDLSILKELANKSWLLVFSGLSAVIYLKIDQVMIGSMVSESELGLYSAAVKLSEAWYFIPLIITNALFPAILNAKNKGLKEYTFRLQQLCDTFFGMAFLLAIAVTLISNVVIVFLYGVEYSASSIILKIHIWSSVFIFLRAVLSKWLIAEDQYRFSLVSQLSGALINVILNFLLIPLYGGIGAAIATVISYSVTSFFVLGLFKQTRPIFIIFCNSLILPGRLIFKHENFFEKN